MDYLQSFQTRQATEGPMVQAGQFVMTEISETKSKQNYENGIL